MSRPDGHAAWRRSVAERVRTYFAATGHKTAMAWAAALGVRRQLVWTWLRDDSVPSGEALARLHREGLNLNWLFAGEGPMLRPRFVPPPESGVNVPEVEVTVVQ